ncbi:MAG: hypothetical protein R3E39_30940 [Anaerolineae bacterium]
MTSQSSRRSNFFIIVAVVLLLVAWLTRLTAIDLFPPFIDETVHIYGSEQAATISPLMNAGLGRQGTIWWLLLFQAYQGSPIWIARVATVLAFMPGLAAVIGTARILGGRWSALGAGLLFLFSNYHMFFGRLALADPVAGSAVLLAIYFAARLKLRIAYRDAMMVGLLLCAAIIAKINVLPFIGVPVAAALTLWHGAGWAARGQQLRWLLLALGSAFLPLAAFVLGLRLFDYDFLTNSVTYALNNRGAAPLSSLVDVDRIVNNIRMTYSLVSAYTGEFSLGVLLIGGLLLLAQRRLFLLLCLFGPLFALWLSLIQESRFYVVPVALLYVIAAVAVAPLVNRHRLWRTALVVAVLGWGTLQWLPFYRAAITITEAEELPLPAADMAQYVYSDAAGTDLREARDFIRNYSPAEVIGLFPNCQGFRYLSSGLLNVTCPKINPNGSDIPVLTELMNGKRSSDVIVMLQDVPYVPDTAPGKPILTIERAGGGPAFHIYQLNSAP